MRRESLTKVVIICGAGSTLSDASNVAAAKRPPLDRGFFRSCRRLKLKEFSIVSEYVRDAYGVNVCTESEDSLEHIMAILYADLLNPATSTDDAAEAFRAFLRLINCRIAETTNGIQPSCKSNLYRIVRSLLIDNCVAPADISFITFNYDLHIEKTLTMLERSSSIRKGIIPLITFPYCYQLKNYRLSSPPKSERQFFFLGKRFRGIEILKLHGSLNWFSIHKTSNPPPKDIICKDIDLWITPRRKIATDMTMRINKKQQYTFPLVVPPVVNKAAIMHNALGVIWKKAIGSLANANRIIVFGYSCPQADQESANLISRSLRKNNCLDDLSIIDPSTNAFDRFADLSRANTIHYYRSARSYLKTATSG